MPTRSRRAFVTLVLGSAAALAGGCRVARAAERRAAPAQGTGRQSATAGRSRQSIDVEGTARTYLRYEPASLPADGGVPLLVVLHGRGGTGTIAERAYGMSARADAHGFVVVYPDALGDPPTWSSGPGQAPGRPDDVAFVRALVERERAARPIDAGRTFACGHSNGGMLGYRLAAEAADLFPAIGVVAGAAGFRLPNGRTMLNEPRGGAVSVIHIHGTADPLVPYDGGGWRGQAGPCSVAESIGRWVAHNGCSESPTIETVGIATRAEHAGGRDGSAVLLWTIQDGGHEWPGNQVRARRGDGSESISASDEIWAFFAAHGGTV